MTDNEPVPEALTVERVGRRWRRRLPLLLAGLMGLVLVGGIVDAIASDERPDLIWINAPPGVGRC